MWRPKLAAIRSFEKELLLHGVWGVVSNLLLFDTSSALYWTLWVLLSNLPTENSYTQTQTQVTSLRTADLLDTHSFTDISDLGSRVWFEPETDDLKQLLLLDGSFFLHFKRLRFVFKAQLNEERNDANMATYTAAANAHGCFHRGGCSLHVSDYWSGRSWHVALYKWWSIKFSKLVM